MESRQVRRAKERFAEKVAKANLGSIPYPQGKRYRFRTRGHSYKDDYGRGTREMARRLRQMARTA